MSKPPRTLIWVCPEFKKKLKMAAASENKTMLDFTKEISLNSVDKELRKWKDEFKI